jgi:hypothetical protein
MSGFRQGLGLSDSEMSLLEFFWPWLVRLTGLVQIPLNSELGKSIYTRCPVMRLLCFYVKGLKNFWSGFDTI